MEKNNMEEMIEFPLAYTFKAMGENTDEFIEAIRQIFEAKTVHEFKQTESSKGTYVSVSVTAHVNDFDELQRIYADIHIVKGLKYHL